MWEIKQIKTQARKSIRTTYKHAIAVAFLIALLSGTYASTTTLLDTYVNTHHKTVGVNDPQNSSDTIRILFGDYIDKNPHAEPSQIVVMSVVDHIINSIIPKNSIMISMVKALNSYMDSRWSVLLFFLLTGIIVRIIYKVFFANILSVGACRFYMESRIYRDTKISRIFHVFNIRKLKKVSCIIFAKDISQVLWYLTIVGGFIKHYEYFAIPYLLAENPDMTKEEAFAVSKKLMYGYKLQTMKLDLTFWGWSLLGIASFGIFDIFYLNTYKSSSHAEVYAAIRQRNLELGTEECRYFVDPYLTRHYLADELPDSVLTPDEYPDALAVFPVCDRHMALNPQRTYSFVSLVLIFITFSMIGWLWEFVLHIVQDGEFVKRGVMWGPWLPIYGAGGVLSIVFFRWTIRRPILNFFMIMLSFTVMEYFSGLFLEITTGYRYWNYSAYILSLHGRVFLLASVFFAVGGCACLYYFGPKLDDFFSRWPRKVRNIVFAVVLTAFLVDTVITIMNPHAGPHPAGPSDFRLARTHVTMENRN